jgi:hypothetical protein
MSMLINQYNLEQGPSPAKYSVGRLFYMIFAVVHEPSAYPKILKSLTPPSPQPLPPPAGGEGDEGFLIRETSQSETRNSKLFRTEVSTFIPVDEPGNSGYA